MAFKFENLEVWNISLDYLDYVYQLADRLPKEEVYNLLSQWIRAATSISLNIAEGSTGQSNPEQNRFLGYAIRSVAESAACFQLTQRRGFIKDYVASKKLEEQTDKLVRKLQSFRKVLLMNSKATKP